MSVTIGVDIGGTKIAAGVVSATGEILARTRRDTPASTYQAQCHCGHHKWEWTLESDKQSHILCHCDTCKVLSGGPYTLNQIVPKSALKITSGGEPAKYSYKGDSGEFYPSITSHQHCARD